MQINRNNLSNATNTGVTAAKNTPVERAIANRNHPFWIGRRVVGALQRLAHVLSDGPGDEQHVGVARGRDEMQAEAFEIVERVVERMDFQFAAVARAGVDLANGQAAAKPAARRMADASGELGQHRVVLGGPRLGERPAHEAFEQNPAHAIT